MITVYLLRHGRTAMDVLKRSDGWLDLPLSDKGRMGLIEAQQYLKLEPIRAIYASPLRRTQETAHIIQSGVLKCPDVKSAQDAITWDLGVLAGMPKKEAHPEVKRLTHSPDDRPLGGESYNAFKKRFMSWFNKRTRAARADGKSILFVLSGSNMRLLGSELFEDSDCLNLDEGGLAALHYAHGRWHKEVVFGDKDKSEFIS